MSEFLTALQGPKAAVEGAASNFPDHTDRKSVVKLKKWADKCPDEGRSHFQANLGKQHSYCL